MEPNATAAKLYQRLATVDREGYLRRARTAARYTIPYLCPPSGFGPSSDLPTPFQGIGERGVRNLASKLLLTLLPPNQPFIKLGLTPEMEAQAEGSEGDFDEAFSSVERLVTTDLETTNIRVKLFEALMQLMVAGNVLIQFLDNDAWVVHKLSDYVVRRDPDGKVKTIILKQKVLATDIPPDIREMVDAERMMGSAPDARVTSDDKLDLYTMVRRTDRGWAIHQEVNNVVLPGSEGMEPEDLPSFLPLRMISIDGEDYGRSYVEELLGDLISYDALSQHILEGSAAMAKMLLVRKPNASVKAKDLKLPNLSIITGNVDDVGVIHMEKSSDFSVALQMSHDLKERLEYSFLLTTAIQRNAERVTAEEIRTMAGELEDALGGVYSTLSQEIQVPLATRQLRKLSKQGRLPEDITDTDIVQMTITTGLSALGRGHDLQRLRLFIQDLAGLAQAGEMLPELERGEAIKRLAAAHGIEQKDLVLTQEQVAEKQQAALQQQQMMEMAKAALTSGAATQLTKAATESPPG